MKNYAIILASGTGNRFGSQIPKQFLKINNKTIFEHSIEAFENATAIDEIIIIITPEYKSLGEEIIAKNNYKKIKTIKNGGKTRKESSFIGISSISDTEANVLIHDCARPLVSQQIIEENIKALKNHSAVCTAIFSSDTLLEIQDGIIKNIPERKNFMRAQTPQSFRLSLIKKAHKLSANDNDFTDDCGLINHYQLADIFIVNGNENNIKITYQNDIIFATEIINAQNE